MVSHHIAGRLTGQVYWERSEERRVGKDVKISVDLGGRRIIKKKINQAVPQVATRAGSSVWQSVWLLTRRSRVQFVLGLFFFKQKTAYEISECDWSSDVCSSDLARDECANDARRTRRDDAKRDDA